MLPAPHVTLVTCGPTWSDGAVPHATLSRRNRLLLRSFELRSSLRFGVAKVDWPAASHAVLAAFAVVGGCHTAAHTAQYRASLAARAPSTGTAET
jgi:hypothetical protein